MTTLLYDFFTYLKVAVRESRGLGERIFCLIVRPQKVQCQNGTRQSPEPAASSGPPMRLGRAQTRPSSTAFPRPSAGGRTGRGPTGAGTPSWWAASTGHAAFTRYAAVMPQYQPQLSISLWYHHTVINNSKPTQSCLNKDTWVGTQAF